MISNLVFTCAIFVAVHAQGQPTVTSLVQGQISGSQTSSTFLASVTLVQDGNNIILVDTPTSTDTAAKMTMMNAMQQKGLSAAQVNMLVVTHGHPDHFGQDGLFPTATHIYNTFKYTGASTFTGITYATGTGAYQLTPNVQLWQTPGHTPQDISVIVNNVPGMGTVAIVGDLFLNAADVSNSQQWQQFATNVQVGLQNRNKVICAANYIVPGHGPMFQVTASMKATASCGTGTGMTNTMGQMRMYPQTNTPLQCTNNANCAAFIGYTNCVRSAQYNHNVCCSTMSC